LWTWRHLEVNVGTGAGDRVSTISLLGCSTSVALATGPTDEEEKEGNLTCIIGALQECMCTFMVISC